MGRTSLTRRVAAPALCAALLAGCGGGGDNAAAPGAPAEGGGSSIQVFGREAPHEERQAAARSLRAYLAALAAHEPAKVCSHLARSSRRELARLAGGARGENSRSPGCPQAMGRLIAASGARKLRGATDIRVRGMRSEDGRAYLVYEDAKGATSATVMVEEGGEWRVAKTAEKALTPGEGEGAGRG